MRKLIPFLLTLLFTFNVEATDIDLKGKAILVTGASSGIGRSIAEALASKGAFVYAGARKQKDINELNGIENMMGIRLDVTRPAEISTAVETIRKQGRGLYGLVNNAGIFFHAPMIEVSEKEMLFMMDVNLFGPYRVTKAFAPLLIESRGRITTTGSISGLVSGPMFGPYSMSKHAIEAFTDALSGEMQKFDVQVSVIEPGNFNSNIMRNMHKRGGLMAAGASASLYTDEYKRMTEFSKSDRSQHKDPSPVAKAVIHALSAEKPKLRYLVAPIQSEADFTLRALLQKVIQLNQEQEHSVSNEALISSFRDLIIKQEAVE